MTMKGRDVIRPFPSSTDSMILHRYSQTSLATALTGSPVTIYFQDADGRFVWFENRQSIWRDPEIASRHESDLFTRRSIVELNKAKSRCQETGEPQTIEVMAHDNGSGPSSDYVLKITLRPSYDQANTLLGFLCTSVDISLEKQRERTLRTLLLEVSHRSKNMLAMVMGLASQTARSATSVDGFVRTFNGRVQSLAKSQNAVTDRDWSGARFSELVRLQVTEVLPIGVGNISITGDDPEFLPSAALHLGLALHELITNALMSGALTDPAGGITLSCQVVRPEAAGDGPLFAEIEWIEKPGRSSEARNGKDRFSRTMLERVVPSAVNGEALLEDTPDFIRYKLTIAGSEMEVQSNSSAFATKAESRRSG